MFRAMKWIAPVAGLALMLGVNQASKAADEAPATAKATVNVTVQDKDGKGVEGVRVRLMAVEAPKSEAAAAEPKAEGDAPAAPAKKPKPIAQGTTDSTGKAALANVPDGEYTLMAGIKGGPAGKEMVKVEGGKDVSVTVTLKEKKAKAPAAQ